MLPGVAQAMPLKNSAAGGSAGSPNGGYPPTLQPRVTRRLRGCGGVRPWAGTARHCPAFGNACTCQNPQCSQTNTLGTSEQARPALPCRPGNSAKNFILAAEMLLPCYISDVKQFSRYFLPLLKYVRFRHNWQGVTGQITLRIYKTRMPGAGNICTWPDCQASIYVLFFADAVRSPPRAVHETVPFEHSAPI